MNNMKVLIADDDMITSLALQRTLRDWGYDVVAARNGDEAWQMANAHQVQLAILDWMMPGMDGVQLARKIRRELQEKQSRYIYILLLSGSDGKEDIMHGLSAGTDDYMTKPFSPAELKVRLQNGERIIKIDEERIKLLSLDGPTKLWNRNRITAFLEEELSRSGREGKPVGLVMFSLDQPASVNERFGVSVGDEVIADAAGRIRRVIRRYDKAGRLGEDEFLVIAAHCGRKEIRHIAGRLVRALGDDPYITDAGLLSVNISCSFLSTETRLLAIGGDLIQDCRAEIARLKKEKTMAPAAVERLR